MRPERLYLADISEAAEAIAEFIAGLEAEDFYRDRKSQSAVLQKLIIIGEAATRLSEDFKTTHPDIEWRDIIAFRNILVHAYFSVQLEIIWETATQDVPTLHRQISEILTQEFK